MTTKMIQLREWQQKNKLDRKLEKIIDVIDDLDYRITLIESRQLKLLEALNELLDRIEQD